MCTSRVVLKSARIFHLYSGVFLTPALLFFAFTGAVQAFNWHETTRGSSYTPPAILAKLAQLHKKETLVLPERKGPPLPDTKPAAPIDKPVFDPSHLGDHTNQQKHDRLERNESREVTPPLAPESRPATSPQTMSGPAPTPEKTCNLFPMKLFSFVAGVGLFLSTLTGLFMSYLYTRNKKRLTAVLLAGLLTPLLLLYLQ